MAGKGRGKRSRDQTSKDSSGITPPVKKSSVAIRRKKTVQTSISEWITDDDITQSRRNTEENTPAPQQTPPSLPPIASQPDTMLSPILSQHITGTERSSSAITPEDSPLSSALNLAASAASLRRDFAICERVMTEKHQLLVTMLDGMSRNVSNIAEKLETLETRVQALEQNEQHKIYNAQGIHQASNSRQNELEQHIKDNTVVINNLKLKCDKMDELSTRVIQIEERFAQRKPHPATPLENSEIAIYGLHTGHTHDDVMDSVNRLFEDMNLQNIQCRYAYRTPSRPEMSRPGIVLAELKCLSDKRTILERKRLIRHMPQYHDVFIKSSKTHTEQVMNANFTVMLNQMTNGGDYYISDNGRIRQKSQTQDRYTDSHGYRTQAQYPRSGYSHGGARPKTSQQYNVSNSRDSYRDPMYNNNHRDDRYASRYTSNTPLRDDIRNQDYSQQIRRPSNDHRRYPDHRPAVNRNDVNSLRSDHTNYGAYSQQYNAGFTVPNQQRYATDQPTTKN